MPVRIRLTSLKATYTLETWGDAPAAIETAERNGGASLRLWRTLAAGDSESTEGVPVFRARYYPRGEDFQRRDFDESWDAYTLRTAFERLTNPQDALAFLNTLGCTFRTTRAPYDNFLTWLELKAWQELVRGLRLIDPMEGWLGGFPHLGTREPSREEDLLLYPKTLSKAQATIAELLSSASDDTYGWLQGVPPRIVIRRDMYLNRADIEEIHSTVEKRFPTPESRVPGSRGSQFAQSLLQHRKTDKARGTPELKQKLIAEIFTATALDAILATVYLDKLRGRDLQVCALRDCNVTFEKSSDSRKTYCSQAHAHLASVRHKREEARKAKSTKARKVS